MDDDAPPIEVVDPEMRQLLGLFDVPAFARRGQDVEYAINRLHVRLRRDREALLDMVRLRLRQWSSLALGPNDLGGIFGTPITDLWTLAGAEAPAWSRVGSTPRKRRAAARDLIASLDRFNRRWDDLMTRLDLGPVNRAIDEYNRYYLIEKECSLGSARLAGRLFVARSRISIEELRSEYPPLPTPTLRAR